CRKTGCDYFRWKDSFFRESNPPSVHSSEASPRSTPPPATAPSASEKNPCPYTGCGSSRIRKDCGRQMCQKHCIASGGCLSKPHFISAKTSQVTRASIIQAASQHSSTSPSTAGLDERSPSPSIPAQETLFPPVPSDAAPSIPTQQTLSPPVPSNAAPSTSRNALPDPRYASHMPPIFTEQWEREQQLREERRCADAARIEGVKRAKHTVVVYAWSEVRIFDN
ncbi:hypothetical protein H0H92_008255, partial [Tricholoma furcatifolium]